MASMPAARTTVAVGGGLGPRRSGCPRRRPWAVRPRRRSRRRAGRRGAGTGPSSRRSPNPGTPGPRRSAWCTTGRPSLLDPPLDVEPPGPRRVRPRTISSTSHAVAPRRQLDARPRAVVAPVDGDERFGSPGEVAAGPTAGAHRLGRRSAVRARPGDGRGDRTDSQDGSRVRRRRRARARHRRPGAAALPTTSTRPGGRTDRHRRLRADVDEHVAAVAAGRPRLGPSPSRRRRNPPGGDERPAPSSPPPSAPSTRDQRRRHARARCGGRRRRRASGSTSAPT